MARPEVNTGDKITDPIVIEKMSYSGPAFRLEDGKRGEIWCLVDTHNQTINRNKQLQIKDTLVYPII
jgi:hypothetical protein